MSESRHEPIARNCLSCEQPIQGELQHKFPNSIFHDMVVFACRPCGIVWYEDLKEDTSK